MPAVTVECSNPLEMRLKVTVEMTVADWKKTLETIHMAEYYAPLDDMKDAIRKAIRAIEQREDVRYSTPAHAQTQPKS